MLRRFAFAFALGITSQAFGQDLFKDPQDGAFDASEWLLDKKGFLPVPMLITEPAVGYGFGAALVFFRESLRERAAKVKPGERLTPPDIYVAAFAATQNGTKVAGGGGLVTFAEDRWRWLGFVGRPDVNLDFYGRGGKLDTGDRSIGYNIDGWLSTQQLTRRLGETNNFVGAKWMWLDLDTQFDPGRPEPVLPPRSRGMTSSGVGVVFEHDARDNFFSAEQGWKTSLEALFYAPGIGSDNEYQMYRGQLFGYLPVDKFVLGARVNARGARGDVPFYQLPFIELRGVPVARYQDQNAGAVEAEVRWNATPRWALVGFLGTGRAWGSSSSFGDAASASSKGVGFRYLVARRLGLQAGVDVARGPEQTAIYIQAGSAWR